MRLAWVLIATWACCMMALLVQPQHCMGSHWFTKEAFEMEAKPFTIYFGTAKATKESYMKFIKDLYNALTDRADRTGDIPILPLPLDPNDSRQYLHVVLSNGRTSITLAIDVSNVYVLGFKARGTAYFFNDVNPDIYEIVFPDSFERRRLPFTGQYGQLENAAGVGRREIDLGIGELGYQIDNIDNAGGETRATARALIVMIQMIAEAVRFRNIMQKVVASIHGESHYDNFRPDAVMLEYETSWGRLSRAVQSADQYGIFPEVRLSYDAGDYEVVQTVRQIIFFLAIMTYECRRNNYLEASWAVPEHSISLPNHDYLSSSVVTPLITRFILQQKLQQEMRCFNYKADVECDEILEPKVHITGFDGLCATVKDDDYHNGNGIVLSECRDGQDNQLWSLRTDQTIRSKGWCLTTYGYSQGDYVMIYDCETAVPDATKWQILSDVGSIKNPKSGLYLTLYTTKDLTDGLYHLCVKRNDFTPRQAWLPTNVTNPSVSNIVGFQSLCLTQRGTGTVTMLNCDRNDINQRWAIYPDGTIRPQQQPHLCLQYDVDLPNVYLGNCSGWVGERWSLQADGTIMHVSTELVMTFEISTTPYVVTVNDNVGDFTQIWFLEPDRA